MEPWYLNNLVCPRDSEELGYENEGLKCFDRAYSYSVLQHFAKQDAILALNEIARVLRQQGKSLVQMANFSSVRPLYHQARRGFKAAKNFEVRYWGVPELKRAFKSSIGATKVRVDCFGGLGSDWTW